MSDDAYVASQAGRQDFQWEKMNIYNRFAGNIFILQGKCTKKHIRILIICNFKRV